MPGRNKNIFKGLMVFLGGIVTGLFLSINEKIGKKFKQIWDWLVDNQPSSGGTI